MRVFAVYVALSLPAKDQLNSPVRTTTRSQHHLHLPPGRPMIAA